MSEHSPEPWHLDTAIWTIEDDPKSRHAIASVAPRPEREANARRIVACVNACCDVSTEELEAGVYRGRWAQVKECLDLTAELDALLTAVEALFPADQWDEGLAKAQDVPLWPGLKRLELLCKVEELLALRAAIAKAKGQVP